MMVFSWSLSLPFHVSFIYLSYHDTDSIHPNHISQCTIWRESSITSKPFGTDHYSIHSHIWKRFMWPQGIWKLDWFILLFWSLRVDSYSIAPSFRDGSSTYLKKQPVPYCIICWSFGLSGAVSWDYYKIGFVGIRWRAKYILIAIWEMMYWMKRIQWIPSQWMRSRLEKWSFSVLELWCWTVLVLWCWCIRAVLELDLSFCSHCGYRGISEIWMTINCWMLSIASSLVHWYIWLSSVLCLIFLSETNLFSIVILNVNWSAEIYNKWFQTDCEFDQREISKDV